MYLLSEDDRNDMIRKMIKGRFCNLSKGYCTSDTVKECRICWGKWFDSRKWLKSPGIETDAETDENKNIMWFSQLRANKSPN